MTIRINGLGSSGLDINTLVSQMMQAKRVPIDQMNQKVTALGWQVDAYRDMNTDLSAFMTEAQKLTLQSNFLLKTVSMSSSDVDKVKVSATANALGGNFSLKVTQLAKSASITSSGALGLSSNPSQALAADAVLQITGNAGTSTVTIANTDNVSQVVSKINAATTTTGVKASYDQLTDKVTIVNTQTGAAGNVLRIQDTSGTNLLLDKLKISDSGDSTTTPDLSTTLQTNVSKGQDAIVNFNGTGDVSVNSNSFKLNDFNFTLLADPGGTPYTINGSSNTDVDQAVATIKGVFDKYNALIDKINGKITETKYRDYSPLTDTQKQNMKDSDIALWEQKAKSGLLRDDSILSTGLDKMRLNLSDPVSGIPAGQYKSLADIGITTAPPGTNLAYMENGKIYIDEDKLRTALTNAPDQVANLFTKDGARDGNGKLTIWNDAGIGTRLYETVKNDIVNGISQKTQLVPTKSLLLKQIDDYTSNITEAEAGLNDYEQQLYSQFASMQTALDKLNSQGSYLSNLFQSK